MKQELVALPCCGYTDASAVKWNPLNGVVQCHNCGQNYAPSQRTWQGLTDADFREIYETYPIVDEDPWDYERAIELKLKGLNE